jgi:hypothetical protein
VGDARGRGVGRRGGDQGRMVRRIDEAPADAITSRTIEP